MVSIPGLARLTPVWGQGWSGLAINGLLIPVGPGVGQDLSADDSRLPGPERHEYPGCSTEDRLHDKGSGTRIQISKDHSQPFRGGDGLG